MLAGARAFSALSLASALSLDAALALSPLLRCAPDTPPASWTVPLTEASVDDVSVDSHTLIC